MRLPALLFCFGLVSCGPHRTPDDEGPGGAGSIGPSNATTPSRNQAPLTGGTLSIIQQGRTAVVADLDASMVMFVRLADGARIQSTKFPAGSQPTRSVEDGEGRLHVLLRGTGQVATVDPTTGVVLNSDSVCAEPRGLTWDGPNQRIMVACAGGELVVRPLVGSSRVLRPGGELRDVMIDPLGTFVSTFRNASLRAVAIDGTVMSTQRPPPASIGTYKGQPVSFEPNTAWKTLVTPTGDFVMVHQWAVNADVQSTTDLAGPAFVRETTTSLEPILAAGTPYYGAYVAGFNTVTKTIERPICSTGVVRSVVSRFSHDGALIGSKEVVGILPIDAAVSPDGQTVAIAMAGNHVVTQVALSTLTEVKASACGAVQPAAPATASADPIGQPTGVAFTPGGTLVVHSRQPAELLVMTESGTVARRIDLRGANTDTPGHTLFHTAAAAVACASCHPEAGEDGHVWNFFGELRRTQPLGGGLASTAPYHWRGTITSMSDLMSETFVTRMGGLKPNWSTTADLTAFLDSVPARKAPGGELISSDVAKRGRAVFEQAACNSCHSGQQLTNNLTVDVGTGGEFQVPSLKGLASRAPYMHSGCAPSLRERFSDPNCGGGTQHGNASVLSPPDLDALLGYLETL